MVWFVFLLLVVVSAAPAFEPDVYDGTVEFRAARQFLASGQPEKAAELLEDLIKKAPFVEVALLLASAFEAMHLVDDAQVVRLQALGLERASNSTPIANAHREWCRVKAIQTQVLCEQNSDPYDQSTAACKQNSVKDEEGSMLICENGSLLDQEDKELGFLSRFIKFVFGYHEQALELAHEAANLNIESQLTKFYLLTIWKCSFFETEGIEAAYTAAEYLYSKFGSEADVDVLSAFYNSLAYTQPFRPETLALYASLVRLSAKGVDGGSRIPVANWSDAGDEVTVQLLAKAGPPLHAVINSTNRTNGEFLPILFLDRDTELVTINSDVILYSETPIIQSDKFIYPGVPSGLISPSGSKLEFLHDFSSSRVIVISSDCCRNNFFHALVECIPRVITAVTNPEILQSLGGETLHLLLDDIPIMREFSRRVHLNNYAAIIWHQPQTHIGMKLSNPKFIHFSLPTASKLHEDCAAENCNWEYGDVFNRNLVSRSSLLAERIILWDAFKNEQQLKKKEAKVVFIMREHQTRSFQEEHQVYLLERLSSAICGAGYSSCDAFQIFNTSENEESKTLQYQHDMFRSVDVLVGCHGAGLTNMLWMEAGSSVFYIPVRPLVDVSYLFLAAALQLRLQVVENLHSYMYDSVRVDNPDRRHLDNLIDQILERKAEISQSKCNQPFQRDEL